VRGQLRAMCELGALPMDTDLDAVIADLNLEGPPLDPTAVSADDLIAEVQRVTKALVGYGARIPKELLLFVKNMVFLDGAIATLAPDLDLLGEIQHVALYFAQTHGLELAAQAGVDPNAWQFDQNAVKDAFGVDRSLDRLTYRDLQERRDLIRKRLESRRKK
jgi:ubiquinone biosynthesis protein